MSEHLTNIVVVGLIARDGKVFVARRAKTKTTFPDRFELVGGHLDPGETLEAALAREIMEEIKVEVVIGAPIHAFTYESEDVLKVEICYLCALKNPEVEPVLNPEDHSEGRWIGEGELHLMEKEDEEIDALRKAFKVLGENHE